MFINKRLITEYRNILKTPIPDILTHPLEDNILEWHYAIYATKGDYNNGCYHGKLIFPEEYPMKPPKIFMFTPNGRFETNTRLCLSISDFHPETWNPSWNVEKILIGLYSFMLDDQFSDGTIGSIKDTSENRIEYAKQSMAYNMKNELFTEMFSKIQKNPNLHSGKLEKSIEKDILQKYCRYCIEKDGELIAPCKCTGTNKWVHPKCLAKWQYTSIISQSTHPKYQTNIDIKCNVCQSPFTILKYNRDDLMLEFTGIEIASMINKGYYIVSGKDSSRHNTEIINKFKTNFELVDNLKHWTYSVFLITDIIKEQSGDKMKDGVHGVSLTRHINISNYPKIYLLWQNYIRYFTNKNFVINHFIGGPCNPDICFALCLIKKNIVKDIILDNSPISIIETYNNNSDTILVFGQTHIICELLSKIPNIIVYIDNKIHINIFWGLAGWSRTQLLGEIAKGGWGLMKGNTDQILPRNSKIWSIITEKKEPIFAGKNDFSSKYDIED